VDDNVPSGIDPVGQQRNDKDKDEFLGRKTERDLPGTLGLNFLIDKPRNKER